MNKQELIERIENLPCFEGPIACTVTVNREWILNSIEQLDQPQKIQVPQFVADYIKDAKYYEWDLDDVFDHITEESGGSEISEWFYTLGNVDVFARAWLDGYTVEEEKRYRVKMKNIHSYSSILKLDDITGEYFFGSEVQMCVSSSDHTRQELEDAGFGWVFDCPGIEIEEVK
jgi:hypothetical protein|nr:MAG TPA: Protein of unknown function (DUF1642) [Caudoviricetes sp.]